MEQTDALELAHFFLQLGSPTGLPFSFESLGGDRGSFLAAATKLHGQGTPQRSREPGRNMGMFNHQERYKTSDEN